MSTVKTWLARWKERRRQKALHSAEVRQVIDGAKAGVGANGANGNPIH